MEDILSWGSEGDAPRPHVGGDAPKTDNGFGQSEVDADYSLPDFDRI